MGNIICQNDVNNQSYLRNKSSSSKELSSIIYQKVKVSICQGDILQNNSESIALVQDEKISFGNKIARHAKLKAGQVAVDECREYLLQNGMLKPGFVFVTNGGNLLQNYIVHANVPQFDLANVACKQLISNTIYEILMNALIDKQLASIVMPLCYSNNQIGFKNLNIIGIIMLKSIKQFLEKFISSNLHIKQITVISADKIECDILVKAFQDVFIFNDPSNLRQVLLTEALADEQSDDFRQKVEAIFELASPGNKVRIKDQSLSSFDYLTLSKKLSI